MENELGRSTDRSRPKRKGVRRFTRGILCSLALLAAPAANKCQPEPPPCTTNSDCASGEFCSSPIAACGTKGTCTKKPQICPTIVLPVCGCDNKTYNNTCEAERAGVSVASQGACGAGEQFCGGIAGIPCPGSGKCIDNPNDSCDPANGGADCGGICLCPDPLPCPTGTHWDKSASVCACVPDTTPAPTCGGIAALPCPGAGTCVDDPNDGCDPNAGGADCGGICLCRGPVPCPSGTVWDGSASVCACKPVVPPIKCGANTCGAGQYCCNASCGICAPMGAACIQIACDATQ